MLGVASRNDVLNLAIQLYEIDLAIAAQSVLKISQVLNEFGVRFACIVVAELVPIRAGAQGIAVSGKAGSGRVQFPDSLHRVSSICLNNLRCLISRFARVSA